MDPLHPVAAPARLGADRQARSVKPNLKGEPEASLEAAEATFYLLSLMSLWSSQAAHLEQQCVLQSQRRAGGVGFVATQPGNGSPRPLVPPYCRETASSLVQNPHQVLTPAAHLQRMASHAQDLRGQLNTLIATGPSIDRALLDQSLELLHRIERLIACLQPSAHGAAHGLNALFGEDCANEEPIDPPSLTHPCVFEHLSGSDNSTDFSSQTLTHIPTDSEALSPTP